MSTVYKALDDATGSSVVIKSYHKKKMSDKHYHKLEREVCALNWVTEPMCLSNNRITAKGIAYHRWLSHTNTARLTDITGDYSLHVHV